MTLFIGDFKNFGDKIEIAIKSRQYKTQDLKEVKELKEFSDVYIYNALEAGEIWNVYFTKTNEEYYKCGEEKCSCRLKIVLKEDQEEIQEENGGSNTQSIIISQEIKVPLLKIFISGEHDKHNEDYKEKLMKRMKSKYFSASLLYSIEIGIHPLVKILIKRLELYCQKPKRMQSNLRYRPEIKEGYVPTKTQLASYASALRKKSVEACVKESLGSLHEFITINSIKSAKKEEDLICIDSNLKSDDFIMIMSSRVLLENVIRQQNQYGETYFYVDATYKLLLNGFILLTLGTENSSHQFRFIGCAIVAREDTKSCERFLSKIKETFYSYYKFDWSPFFLVSDAADSINLAVSRVFPGVPHYRCYFHSIKAVKDKIQRYKNASGKKIIKENWPYVHYAMKQLHMTLDDEDFMDLWNLIEKDWLIKNIPETFIKYFTKTLLILEKNLDGTAWTRSVSALLITD